MTFESCVLLRNVKNKEAKQTKPKKKTNQIPAHLGAVTEFLKPRGCDTAVPYAHMLLLSNFTFWQNVYIWFSLISVLLKF